MNIQSNTAKNKQSLKIKMQTALFLANGGCIDRIDSNTRDIRKRNSEKYDKYWKPARTFED